MNVKRAGVEWDGCSGTRRGWDGIGMRCSARHVKVGRGSKAKRWSGKEGSGRCDVACRRSARWIRGRGGEM